MGKDARLLEWQRKLDPSNFNKKHGAQYHTAPSVIFPDSIDYPKGVPDESVTIMFFFSDECWLCEKRMKLPENVVFVEKPPRKNAKHGPVVIMTATEALAVLPVNENWYWSAQVLTSHEIKRCEFRFPKNNTTDDSHGSKKRIACIATFMPDNDMS